MDILTIFVAIFAMTVLYMFLSTYNSQRKLPPGPVPLPVIGTLYHNIIGLEKLANLRKQYGDISTHYFGKKRILIFSSYNVNKELGELKTCLDRAGNVSFGLRLLNPNFKGIVQRDFTEELRMKRSHSLSILRSLGVGRSTMEDKIVDEAVQLVEAIRSQNEEPFDPWHILSCSVMNVLMSIIMNKKYKHVDPEFLEIVQYTDDVISTFIYLQYVDTVNFLRFIPPFKAGFLKLVNGNKEMLNYMWKYAAEHIRTFTKGHISDFMDGWLDKNYNDELQKPDVDEEDFRFVLRDFLIAGSETAATSLRWTVIQLANRPDIQAKLHKELDYVVGGERSVRLADRINLPYVEAFMWEIQRYFTVVPLSLFHHTKTGVNFRGYNIPANTSLVMNLHAVHMNDDSFGDPENFRPERFINTEGKCVKHPHVVPFGIGKRSCLGELLAKQELFIFTATLVQKFQIQPPDGVEKIDDHGDMSFTHIPKHFRIRALRR